jgi:hypothetical protein
MKQKKLLMLCDLFDELNLVAVRGEFKFKNKEPCD